jgi:hypothetical protein
VRTGHPTPQDLSSRSWVGERAAELLPPATERLWQGALAHRPVVAFLGGSAVHGELCGIEDAAGERRYLSDLDLGILTDERVPGELQQSIRRGLAGHGAEGPELQAGFYCRADRERQHPTPGFVEAVREGFVLQGDPAALGEFRVPDPGAIPRWESRRLLCNRALEVLGALDPAHGPVDRLYALSKLAADAAAVLLIDRGAYRGGGFAERSRAVRSLSLDEPLKARIAAWTAWRLDPRWGVTPLGVDAGGVEPARIEAEARKVLQLILQALSPGNPRARAVLSPPGVHGRAWARSWKRWCRREPAAALRTGPDALSRSPRVLLWEAALGLLAGDAAAAGGGLGRLTGRRAEGFEALRSIVVQSARAMENEGVE